MIIEKLNLSHHAMASLSTCNINYLSFVIYCVAHRSITNLSSHMVIHTRDLVSG